MALNQQVHDVFAEEQVYRIDHYLGKETVQNLIVFRFANAIFEPIWNRNYIDHVQITVAETVGVESRAGYYDTAGVGRDMLQNHLLQLLTLTAMEPPYAFDARALRDEKVKVLQALRPIPPADTMPGQYIGYRNEKGVAPKSQTPTYAAVKTVHRQLALAGRAVLPALRQAAGRQDHGNLDRVQAPAAFAVSA